MKRSSEYYQNLNLHKKPKKEKPTSKPRPSPIVTDNLEQLGIEDLDWEWVSKIDAKKEEEKDASKSR